MVERNNGGHAETLCTCPHCGKVYVIQHGGQNGGRSPSTYVPSPEELSIGYCNIRCLYLANGRPIKSLEEQYAKMGLNFDVVCPPGYLAPARIPNISVQLDTNRNLQENSNNINGRR